MYIQISQDPVTGLQTVELATSDSGSNCSVLAKFVTPQVVTLEVVNGSKVLLHGTRINGVKIEGDKIGDAWLTTRSNRVNP